MAEWLLKFRAEFILNFIKDNRWKYIVNGLGVTLQVTFFALFIGVAIGVIVAVVRSTYDKLGDSLRPGVGRNLIKFFDSLCRLYLTVIRGTPVVLQLMIMFYVIFGPSNNKILAAILAFGINSGAYVAEIVRGGIMSVDLGQNEAGRSLGFNYIQTMRYIIIPQAFKNILPSLANEFIVLIKETSVCGYIALQDLTKGADIIRGRTFSAFMPLIAAALVYLIMVIFFTQLVGRLERRLRNSDH